MNNRFGYPALGFGLGLRAPHYDEVLAKRPRDVDWFEIISENFLEAHQGYWDFLADLRQDYPIVMHGVSLSIGSTDPLDYEYLVKLKKLADFIDTTWVSDHLCWTGIQQQNTHDLLPVPYTQASLEHVVGRICRTQDILQRHLVLENPSTYLEFNESTIPEWEFVSQVAVQADCGVLLDVNNVYVSAFNHGYDPKRYIDAVPADRIVQIHLAGHLHLGTHIIDTHDHQVVDEVWKLYEYTLSSKGLISTMIEWDEHIPAFGELALELAKARKLADTITRHAA